MMKLKSGSYYKTRDGRKVGPVWGFGFPGYLSATVDGEDRVFDASNGNHEYGMRDLDLVAEWVDEPAAVAEATAAVEIEFTPAPQVGDAVLIPGVITGITNSTRGTNYNIVFETQNRRVSLHFLEEDFILDQDEGDEGDCLCANNDNGPLPTGDTAKAFDALGDWLRTVAINPSAAFRSNKEAA